MGIAWVFPGQGSPRDGWSAVLDEFPALTGQAGAILGRPVRDVLADRDNRTLGELHVAQFMVTVLHYLRHARRAAQPDFLAGHSLGEYAALYAAGCLDLDTAIRLVLVRGNLIGSTGEGAMMAVIGWPIEALRALLAEHGIAGIDVANENLPDQIVLSGPRDQARVVADAVRATGRGKAVFIGIDVAGHSRYLAGIAARFAEHLRAVSFVRPEIPVVSNVTAQPHRLETLPDLLCRQLCEPVRWWDTMCFLMDNGVTGVEELGAGDVLTKLWARANNRRSAAPLSAQR